MLARCLSSPMHLDTFCPFAHQTGCYRIHYRVCALLPLSDWWWLGWRSTRCVVIGYYHQTLLPILSSVGLGPRATIQPNIVMEIAIGRSRRRSSRPTQGRTESVAIMCDGSGTQWVSYWCLSETRPLTACLLAVSGRAFVCGFSTKWAWHNTIHIESPPPTTWWWLDFWQGICSL